VSPLRFGRTRATLGAVMSIINCMKLGWSSSISIFVRIGRDFRSKLEGESLAMFL
jgi:hypothetical protein